MAQARDAVDDMLTQWATERPDLDTSGMAVVLRVQMLAGLLAERLRETLEPSGLAPFEFDVLSALRRAGTQGGLTPTELCESAQLTSGGMTHRLDRLEERGLVRRTASREDRRSYVISLTPEGRSLIDEAVVARTEDAAECIAVLTQKERADLGRLLRSVHLWLTEPDEP